MDYVCKVVGNLSINDINLNLSYMEIIDLSNDDFKSSPQLREALRTGKIEPYNRTKHKSARRIKSLAHLKNIPISNGKINKKEISTSEGSLIKESLDNLSIKMTSLLDRINTLIQKNVESNEKISGQFEEFTKFSKNENINSENFSHFLKKTLEYHDKLDTILNNKTSETDKKLDKLIDKLDKLITNNVTVQNNYSNLNKKTSKNKKKFDDKVTFVPNINVDNVEKSEIKAEQIKQEGTQDILDRLKKMKENK